MRKTNLTKGAVKYAIVTASAFMLTYGAVSAEGTLLTAYADEVTIEEEAEEVVEEQAAGELIVDDAEEKSEEEELVIEDIQEGEENEINQLSEAEPASLEELRGGSWYLDGVEKNEEDGFYYVEDTEGNPVKIVDSYVQLFLEGKNRFVYIDKEGQMVKGKPQWLGENGEGGLTATEENKNAGWRYINKYGYVLVNRNEVLDKNKTCYCFDKDGVYTVARDKFFEVEDGEEVIIYYANPSGGAATDDSGNLYCFVDNPEDLPEDYRDGRYCYSEIIEKTEDNKELYSYELAKSVWIGGTKESGWMYVDKNGRLLCNENSIIEDWCCTFDSDFKGQYIKSETFFEVDQTESDDAIWAYCTSDDHKAAGNYDGEKPLYYYFKDNEEGKRFCYIEKGDGSEEQVTSIWIGGTDEGGWLRVDSDGCLLQNTTSIFGAEFYEFDEKYKGRFIKESGKFILLEEGENPEEDIWGYCRVNGKAAGQNVDGKFVHYYFKKNDKGKYICYRSDNDEKAVHIWIDGAEESGFMYTNSNGRLLQDTNRIVDGDCCHFDENCKGSYIQENTFFVTYEENPDNEEEDIKVWRYCTSDNHRPAGDATGAYRFMESGETYLCYREDKTPLSEIWMEEMWINADGLLVKNSDHELIDGKYYEVNNYKCELLTNTIISIEADGETKTYYVDANGEIVKNQFVFDDGEEYYFDAEGLMVKSAWVENETYYMDADGHKVTDKEYQIGEKLYYFDADGKATLLDGYVELGDCNYYYENNQMVTNAFRAINGGEAYFDGKGEQVYGDWVEEIYYVDADGFKVVDQKFVDIDGVRYDFAENGVASTVNRYITVEDKNYFYENGEKLVNVFKVIETGKEAYFGDDGAQCFSQWIDKQYVGADGFKVVSQNYVIIEGKEYNFDAEGKGTILAGFVTKEDGKYYYVQGEKTIDDFVTDEGGKMYFGTDGKQVLSGWVTKDNYQYYVEIDGYVVTNENHKVIDGKAYSMDTDGRAKVVEGHIALGKNKYYYEDGVAVVNAFRDVEGGKAYFGEDGAQLFSQWIKSVEGNRYVDANGLMIFGKDKEYVDGEPYYFDTDGVATLLVGYVTINGKNYYYEDGEKVKLDIRSLENGLVIFDNDGKQVVNDWIVLNKTEDRIGDWYLADETGYLVTTGYYYLQREGKYYYFYSDGKMAEKKFIPIDGGLAYFGENGYQRFSAWINEGKDGYVDANGFKVMNAVNCAIKNKNGVEEYYDFDENGKWSYAEGFRTIGGMDCYLKKGVIQKDIFVDTEAGTYYFNADGELAVMNWFTLDGKTWYFAKEDGLLVKDTLYYLARENKYYHFNKDGVMSSSTFVDYNGQIIYLGSSGAQRFSDWAGNDTDGWRYLGEDGYAVRNVENMLVGDVYYNFDANGYATAVTYTISYELDGGKNNTKNPTEYTSLTETITLQRPTKPGYTFVGWYADAEFANKVTTIEQKSKGDLILYAKWEVIEEENDDDDEIISSTPTQTPAPAPTPEPEGEVTTDEQKGQVNTVTGIVVGATNSTEDDGLSHWQGTTTETGETEWKMQYADGSFAAGTYVTDETTGETKEQVAWEKVSGSWYAFGADGIAKDGWVKDESDGNWYLIDINNGMQTGWQTDATDGNKYFLDETTGAMKTGWHANAEDGKWYYLDEQSGAMKTGWVLVGGKWYYLNPGNGAMYANQRTPDGYYVNANGEWVPGV